MCGRFSLTLSPEFLATYFGLDAADLPSFQPSFNVAPTEQAPVLRMADGQKQLAVLRWGLTPHWADDPSIGNRMINARSETVASKPAFRSAFRQRRGIVAVDGFFEWLRKGKGPKQPYFIHHVESGQPLALAALWEHWEGETVQGAQPIESFTILTTEANALVGKYHDRMPVVLRPEDFPRWLDSTSNAGDLKALLGPCNEERLSAHPVSTVVNKPGNKGAECVAPVQGELFSGKLGK